MLLFWTKAVLVHTCTAEVL